MQYEPDSAPETGYGTRRVTRRAVVAAKSTVVVAMMNIVRAPWPSSSTSELMSEVAVMLPMYRLIES